MIGTKSREIDLLIEEGDVLYPLEMKKHSDPRASVIPISFILTVEELEDYLYVGALRDAKNKR